jgi:hypothetical protein
MFVFCPQFFNYQRAGPGGFILAELHQPDGTLCCSCFPKHKVKIFFGGAKSIVVILAIAWNMFYSAVNAKFREDKSLFIWTLRGLGFGFRPGASQSGYIVVYKGSRKQC